MFKMDFRLGKNLILSDSLSGPEKKWKRMTPIPCFSSCAPLSIPVAACYLQWPRRSHSPTFTEHRIGYLAIWRGTWCTAILLGSCLGCWFVSTTAGLYGGHWIVNGVSLECRWSGWNQYAWMDGVPVRASRPAMGSARDKVPVGRHIQQHHRPTPHRVFSCCLWSARHPDGSPKRDRTGFGTRALPREKFT